MFFLPETDDLAPIADWKRAGFASLRRHFSPFMHKKGCRIKECYHYRRQTSFAYVVYNSDTVQCDSTTYFR